MKYNLIFIVLVLSISLVHARSSHYNPDLNTLFVPEVEINGHFYIDGFLILEENGTYRVQRLIPLALDQEALLKKINSIPCGQADTLGRFSAYMSFINGNTSYCIVKTPSITIEGGQILSYLFIENGSASIIVDARGDGFRGCCDHMTSTQYDNVQLGYIKEGVFIKQSTLDGIDFRRDYILKLIGDEEVIENY